MRPRVALKRPGAKEPTPPSSTTSPGSSSSNSNNEPPSAPPSPLISTPSSSQVVSPTKLKPGALPVLTRIGNENATYQLGAELGRGGFGAVFQALNIDTGDFVAVKRIELTDVDSDNLSSIELEIDLLKKLNHPNIVKYVDSIRTEHHLHIILEFMENGSLAGVCKKFGNFSESLAAIYMTQVLQGLQYLHEQGVLHRDIKGANILTTKDGQVKLADFGVAIKLNDSKQGELDVVGSPYWMAPEIIEMNAPTSACDIWSLGCTIVELLTGKPPYFDLAPMAALFRIVQDDYPSLPDDISEALRDFLLQCFKKEPLLRKGAQELLKHPWLKNPRNHLEKVKQQAVQLSSSSPSESGGMTSESDMISESGNASNRGGRRGGGGKGEEISGRGQDGEGDSASSAAADGGGEEESVVNTIKMYAKGAIGKASKWVESVSTPASAALGRSMETAQEEDEEAEEDWNDSSGGGEGGEKEATRKQGAWRSLLKDFHAGNSGGSASSLSGPELVIPAQRTVPMEAPLSNASTLEEGEDWDADFDGGKTEGVKTGPPHTSSSAASSNRATAVLKLPTANAAAKANAALSPKARVQDLDDLVIGEEDDDEGGRGKRKGGQQRLSSRVASKPQLAGSTTTDPTTALATTSNTSNNRGGGGGVLDRFAETEEDDGFDDLVIGKPANTSNASGSTTAGGSSSSSGGGGLVLRKKVIEPLGGGVHDDAIFLDDLDFENQPDRGAHLRRVAEVFKIVDQIKPESKDKFVRESCAKIIEIFDAHPEQPSMLIAQHGVIPILQMLEVRALGAMPSILAVINRIIKDDAKVQEHLSFLGFIPTIIKFAGNHSHDYRGESTPTTPSSSHTTGGFLSNAFFGTGSGHRRENSPLLDLSARPVTPLRLEASKCIFQICTNSKLCLQMFIGCGGLPVLVDLLALADDSTKNPEAKKIVLIGIDCVVQIFTHLDIRRNDFCRLFAKLGLLPHLSVAFMHLLNSIVWGNKTDLVFANESWKHIETIANILFYFSRADPYVKGSMAHESVLQAMVRVFSPPSPALLDLAPYAELVVVLLKCVKNMSFQENTLEKLDQVQAIRTLLPLMDRRGHILDKEMENQVLPCMYNLCRVNSKRQEKAAIAGIVPLLQRFYHERSHMKEIALTIICDLAHTSEPTREEMWKNNGVDFYLLLLPENYWQVPALNALSVWLSMDVKRVESVLVRPTSVESLVGMIHSSQGKTFEQISGPLLDMMSKSVPLRKTLGNSTSFILALLTKLQNPKAIVRKPVLMLLKIIYQHHDKKAQFIQKYELYPAMRLLAQDNSQVLVKDLATQLLHDFDRQTKSSK